MVSRKAVGKEKEKWERERETGALTAVARTLRRGVFPYEPSTPPRRYRVLILQLTCGRENVLRVS